MVLMIPISCQWKSFIKFHLCGKNHQKIDKMASPRDTALSFSPQFWYTNRSSKWLFETTSVTKDIVIVFSLCTKQLSKFQFFHLRSKFKQQFNDIGQWNPPLRRYFQYAGSPPYCLEKRKSRIFNFVSRGG